MTPTHVHPRRVCGRSASSPVAEFRTEAFCPEPSLYLSRFHQTRRDPAPASGAVDEYLRDLSAMRLASRERENPLDRPDQSIAQECGEKQPTAVLDLCGATL